MTTSETGQPARKHPVEVEPLIDLDHLEGPQSQFHPFQPSGQFLQMASKHRGWKSLQIHGEGQVNLDISQRVQVHYSNTKHNHLP